MPAPVPKTKAAEVLDRAGALLTRRDLVNDLLLARLKKDARASMSVDPVVAHIALGAIASLEWNDAELDEHFQAALSLEDCVEARQNYATSLSQVERVFDAWEQLRMASQMEPGDLHLLDRTIGSAYVAGDFAAARELCETYGKRSPGNRHRSQTQIERADFVLKSQAISPQQIHAHLVVAYGLLRERKVASRSITVETFVEPGNQLVMYHIRLSQSDEFIESLELELADRLFDQVQDINLGAFWVGYSKEDEEEEEAGADHVN